jgi:hypothetical protein
METYGYRASAQDNPLGDRKDTPERWSPQRVEEVSDHEVKNPVGRDDIDEEAPDEVPHATPGRDR